MLSPETLTPAAQKQMIDRMVKKKPAVGESWALVDARWYRQWQKYVGSLQSESFSVGDRMVPPGPIDNSTLLKPGTNVLREDLEDSIDFCLLPMGAYNKLAAWYGVTAGQEPITRTMIEQTVTVTVCKVEVYLLELKLCQNSDFLSVLVHAFSRADTMGTVEKVMRRLFYIPEYKLIRLWKHYASDSYEMVTKKDQTLQEAGLYQGQIILIEVQNDNGTWPRRPQLLIACSYNYSSNRELSYSGASGSLANDSRRIISRGHGYNGYNAASGSPTSVPRNQTTKSIEYNNSSVSNYHYGYGDRGDRPVVTKPGLCGLANLGNTCFMNAVLQCMFNVTSLTEYMLSNKWENELNTENPAGMNGEIAKTFAELVREVWSGHISCTAPRNFKNAVARFAPQFSGCQKHDSQELMAFLLDGLHEDLNRIKQKIYVELEDSGGRPDKVVAKEAWQYYKKRNDSVIVDNFHGLLKSTIRCPDCGKTSVTFDPFCYLSLPLKEERMIQITWIPLAPERLPMRLTLAIPKTDTVNDMCLVLEGMCNASSKKMAVTDVFQGKIYKVFPRETVIDTIATGDIIFVYEIPVESIDDPDTLILPVYHRFRRSDDRCSGPGSSSCLFGNPFLLAVPRNNCTYDTLYRLVLQQMSRYVRIPESEEDEQESMESSEVIGLDDSSPVCSSSRARANNETVFGQGAEGSNGNGQDAPEIETIFVQDESEESTENKMNSEDNVVSCYAQPTAPPATPPRTHNKRHILTLKAVNRMGQDSFSTVLIDDDEPLVLNIGTYIAVDWSVEEKNKYFDEEAAKACQDHDSMLTRPNNMLKLDDCLKLFMTEEQLNDEDFWYCSDCKQHRQATKKFDLWSLPDVLIIHLKRFSFSKNSREKIDMLVRCPLRGLDLHPHVIHRRQPKRTIYDLIAVVNHAEGGHYTAYAKNKDDENWYNFDDEKVSSLPEAHVVTKSAYVLVYQRRQNKRRKRQSSSPEGHQNKLIKAWNSNQAGSNWDGDSAPNAADAAIGESDLGYQ